MEGAGSAAAQGRQAWPLQQDTQKLTTVISSEHSRAHVGPWLPENPTGPRPEPMDGGGRSGIRRGPSSCWPPTTQPRLPERSTKNFPSTRSRRTPSSAGPKRSRSTCRGAALPESSSPSIAQIARRSLPATPRGSLRLKPASASASPAPLSASTGRSPPQPNLPQLSAFTRLSPLRHQDCRPAPGISGLLNYFPTGNHFVQLCMLTPQASAGSLLNQELPK